MAEETHPVSKARRYIEGDMDVGQEEALASISDLEFDLRMPYEIKIADLERVLKSIATDCRRGAHELGMTPAGVQDIVSRIDRALTTKE